jgi:hypothetical protein
MFAFMLATMPTEEKTGQNCLFVKIEGENFIFTASSPYVIKRKTIVSQPVISKESEKKKEISETFMIPIGDVKGFSEALKSHKSICKKLQEEEEDKNFIEISDKYLSSFGSHYDFEQPKFQFKELQHFFEYETDSTASSLIKSKEIKNLLTGFSDGKQVEMTYYSTGSGEDEEKYIHFNQKATGLEAVFICPKEEIEEDDGSEQTSF